MSQLKLPRVAILSEEWAYSSYGSMDGGEMLSPTLPYPNPTHQCRWEGKRALPAPQQQRHSEEWPYTMPGHHSRAGLEDVGVGKSTLK